MSTVAFLTDFGERDWYVAAMKGVALSINPKLTLVDISHDVPAGDVASGAFILSQCWQEFPAGSAFCVVVDPGVGSARAPVALEVEGRYFIGPDNGLFGWLGAQASAVRRIDSQALDRKEISNTFHGRDIFAPIAAKLASGETPLDQIGAQHPQLVSTPWPRPEYEENKAFGRILYIDHYGNAITNLRQEALEEQYALEHAVISLHPRRLPLLKTFSDAPAGQPLAYFGSGGLLEIAVNGGNAAQQLDLRPEQHVELLLK